MCPSLLPNLAVLDQGGAAARHRVRRSPRRALALGGPARHARAVLTKRGPDLVRHAVQTQDQLSFLTS